MLETEPDEKPTTNVNVILPKDKQPSYQEIDRERVVQPQFKKEHLQSWKAGVSTTKKTAKVAGGALKLGY